MCECCFFFFFFPCVFYYYFLGTTGVMRREKRGVFGIFGGDFFLKKGIKDGTWEITFVVPRLVLCSHVRHSKKQS